MKLVLFDCDGTLVDSVRLIHEVMARTFVAFGYKRPDVSATKSIIGLTLDIAIARLQGKPHVDEEAVAMTAHYKSIFPEVRDEAEADLADERRRAAERLEELKADQKRLSDEFDALSRRALEANSKAFLEQAEERLKRSQSEGAAELQKRQDAVQQLIEPIQKTLDTVKTEMTTAEKARLEAHAALSEQVQFMRQSTETLGAETRNLVNALRAPQVRGRWGELQLRRVVEASGMVNHVDFDEQLHHSTDEGALRPDMVVHLAGDKRVVVDSKVAFNGYLEAMEATDDAVRAQRLAAHARHLKKHIDDLGAKEYWDVVAGSPEFVVMFVPAEPFLAAALDQDATLYEYAFERNVVIATPSTLIALLRTVGTPGGRISSRRRRSRSSPSARSCTSASARSASTSRSSARA